MDHRTAIATTAAERYFLDELDESERKEFEEHYFSCAVCAEQVRDAAVFLGAARPLLAPDVDRFTRTPLPPPLPGSLVPRVITMAASVAFASLLGIVSYQRFVTIPRLQREVLERELSGVEAGRRLPSFFLRSARGEPATVVIAKGERFVVLRLSDSLDQSFPTYRYSLLDATGVTRRSNVLRPPAARTEELEVPLRTEDLGAGAYVLVLEGVPGPAPSDITPSPATARYPFRIERRD